MTLCVAVYHALRSFTKEQTWSDCPSGDVFPKASGNIAADLFELVAFGGHAACNLVRVSSIFRQRRILSRAQGSAPLEPGR